MVLSEMHVSTHVSITRGRWLGSNYFRVKAPVKFKTITAADASCKKHNREASWESSSRTDDAVAFFYAQHSRITRESITVPWGPLANMSLNINESIVRSVNVSSNA